MDSYSCPRCGKQIPSWQPVHVSCFLFRIRFFIGGICIFAFILFLSSIIEKINNRTYDVKVGDEQNTPQANYSKFPLMTSLPTSATLSGDISVQATSAINTLSPTNTPRSISFPSSPTRDISTQTPSTGTWIAYAYGRAREETDIYLLKLETQVIRQLTSGTAMDESPTFSPDGRYLVFTSCRGDCELYKIDLKDNVELQITNLLVQARFPDWCRNSSESLLVFEGRPNRQTHQIWILDLITQNARALTTGPSDSRPVWSPDCTEIAFGRAEKDTDGNGILSGNDYLDLFIINIDSMEETQIIDTPDQDEFNFAWSPNGEWIAFTRVSDDTNKDGFVNLNDRSELFLIHPDGSGERNLTQGRFSVFSPSWSSDSQKILFTVFRGGTNQEIWWYNLRTREFNQVSRIGPYYHPSWSP